MKAAQFQPSDKHVVITGGASGIGLEICRSLAARGVASIAILDISLEALAAGEASLKGAGPIIRTFRADVTSEAEAVQAAHKQAGRLDIVFANAGIGPLGFMKDKDPTFYKKLMDVNYLGVVHTFKAALPIMLKQRSGHLVATNSVSGYAGAPGLSAYSASKYATRGLVESLRLELIGTGVHLHTTAPNFTATPMMAGAQQGLV
ncbi:hypothetical protein WJX73_004013 [Symbiochloris irregularis]|uniref:Ketoreductase domain-containing protein n=1 Tax=Symbiochloris irregularis TaxID=706552 RepID=A0AAW1P167_9CHLO